MHQAWFAITRSAPEIIPYKTVSPADCFSSPLFLWVFKTPFSLLGKTFGSFYNVVPGEVIVELDLNFKISLGASQAVLYRTTRFSIPFDIKTDVHAHADTQ